MRVSSRLSSWKIGECFRLLLGSEAGFSEWCSCGSFGFKLCDGFLPGLCVDVVKGWLFECAGCSVFLLNCSSRCLKTPRTLYKAAGWNRVALRLNFSSVSIDSLLNSKVGSCSEIA